MKPKMQIEIEGIGEYNPSRLPRVVSESVKLLCDYPNGKLIRMQGLADRVGVSVGRMHMFSAHPALAEYRISMASRIVLFGNPKTIRIAKSQLA